MNIDKILDFGRQAMIKLDTTQDIEPGMLISTVEEDHTYMVMMVLNDTDISVIRHDDGVLH